ncbi:vanadium-dependent haloperoxidase [Flavihumibacter rivuli]|uniref:vanadium-dependent haloperoxidase n=1 Tax=Flavihumibacter rivuli TaxID=2838156 RepID=UPI001BDF6E7A|nr:vanadium-dependent haloperoxidase [Flavihumibacter rivuli]ULQ58114.1 vanadium-dependent haloperoxidase [Flavihumibacter rivuli]
MNRIQWSLMKQWQIVLLAIISLASCKQQGGKEAASLNDPEILRQNLNQLTDLIIYDVFTPPVASRIYSYATLASYEAIRHEKAGSPSLTASLKGFANMPEPEKGKSYNYMLAATKAFLTVSYKLTFSIDTLKLYEAELLKKYEDALDKETYERSLSFGDTIGKVILARAAVDNYPQTRGKPRFIGSREPGKWRPTPPDYMDAVEPCWGDMKTFALDSGSQFKAPPHPVFSMDTSSKFYKESYEVYTIGKNLTEEQKTIAKYWDDNPFVIEHAGHMMFANKKITPGGHWMGIAAIATRSVKADAVKTARVLALTAISLMDGFVACWEEKYAHQLIRPVSVINESIEEKWNPFLQTPPFPEYPSGHSVISASAAEVLTHEIGDNFAFHDDSDKAYIGMERDFKSFREAAAEASISRVYGGIHFRSGVEGGARLGEMVGKEVIRKTSR